jgi:hypothetical protein
MDGLGPIVSEYLHLVVIAFGFMWRVCRRSASVFALPSRLFIDHLVWDGHDVRHDFIRPPYPAPSALRLLERCVNDTWQRNDEETCGMEYPARYPEKNVKMAATSSSQRLYVCQDTPVLFEQNS